VRSHGILFSLASYWSPLTHPCRYIVTARGLSAMLDKFKNVDFGRCPRVLCEGQPCLPVGTSDIPGQSTVKVGQSVGFCKGGTRVGTSDITGHSTVKVSRLSVRAQWCCQTCCMSVYSERASGVYSGFLQGRHTDEFPLRCHTGGALQTLPQRHWLGIQQHCCFAAVQSGYWVLHSKPVGCYSGVQQVLRWQHACAIQRVSTFACITPWPADLLPPV
jgi:hypothetical protein